MLCYVKCLLMASCMCALTSLWQSTHKRRPSSIE